MTPSAETLKQRLAANPTVGLIGLGYVGLPLAVAFAESGATVIGVDLDARRVAAVRAGTSFIEDVPAGPPPRPPPAPGRHPPDHNRQPKDPAPLLLLQTNPPCQAED